MNKTSKSKKVSPFISNYTMTIINLTFILISIIFFIVILAMVITIYIKNENISKIHCSTGQVNSNGLCCPINYYNSNGICCKIGEKCVMEKCDGGVPCGLGCCYEKEKCQNGMCITDICPSNTISCGETCCEACNYGTQSLYKCCVNNNSSGFCTPQSTTCCGNVACPLGQYCSSTINSICSQSDENTFTCGSGEWAMTCNYDDTCFIIDSGGGGGNQSACCTTGQTLGLINKYNWYPCCPYGQIPGDAGGNGCVSCIA